MFESSEIEARIKAAYPDAQVEVQDLTGGKDHFQVTVVSTAFEGMNALKRHRAVYALFKAEVGGPIHAFALTTKTPAESAG